MFDGLSIYANIFWTGNQKSLKITDSFDHL